MLKGYTAHSAYQHSEYFKHLKNKAQDQNNPVHDPEVSNMAIKGKHNKWFQLVRKFGSEHRVSHEMVSTGAEGVKGLAEGPYSGSLRMLGRKPLELVTESFNH